MLFRSWLILNGFAYLALCVTGVVLPAYEDVISKVAFPLQLGELAFVLWMVVMGARPPADVAAVSSPGHGA